jgi:threonine aldolase
VCLSKGLGAPVGSVLVSTAERIAEARVWRKRYGGGMRQVGILAAAGLYALEHNVERLAEDHAHAQRLADGLAALGLEVEPVQTNMVFVSIPSDAVESLRNHLDASGVKAIVGPRTRLVTHLDVDTDGIELALAAFAGFFEPR